MRTCLKILYIIGATLTAIGSFLPWWQEGDFISYRTYGIRFYPTIKDNGGLLIMLLIIIMLWKFFRPPRFADNPTWNIAIGGALVFLSCYHSGRLLIRRIEAGRVIGAPVIQIGLIMVSLGSLLLLIAAVLHYAFHSKVPQLTTTQGRGPEE